MENRDSIIKVITSPLGFFALSLLIVEGFLGIIVIGSGATLNPEAKLIGMWMAIGAFSGVTIIVALMVWLIPEHLLLRGEDWMEKANREKTWASSADPKTKSELDKLKGTKEK